MIVKKLIHLSLNLDKKKVKQLKKQLVKNIALHLVQLVNVYHYAGTNAQTEITNRIENAVKEQDGATGNQKAKIIFNTSKKLTGISNSFTGDLTKNAATTLGGKLNSGLKKKIYRSFYKSITSNKKYCNSKESRYSSTSSNVRSCSKITKKITLCD